MPGSASPRPEGVSGSLREAVLAGPGAGVTVPAQVGWNPLAVVVTPAGVEAALAAAGHADKCRAVLTGAVTTVLVVGLCLYCGEGYAGVIGRLWPLLGSFNPPDTRTCGSSTRGPDQTARTPLRTGGRSPQT
jgi:hypothetical protein